MTDSHHALNLHAYSGGTVWDSHPIPYSLPVVSPVEALKLLFHFPHSKIALSGDFVNNKMEKGIAMYCKVC